jgi:hypothetical protein
MKTIIIILSFCLFTMTSMSQVKDTVIIIDNKEVEVHYDVTWNKQVLQKYFNDVTTVIKRNSSKASTGIINILNQIPLSNDACINSGFENDNSGWTGLSLKHSSTMLPIENGLTTNPGISPLPLTGNSFGGNFTEIENVGTDSYLLSLIPSFSLQKVKSGNKSLKLGNNFAGFGAEGVAKRFLVTATNAQYYFQYAVIMDKSHSNTNGSMIGSEVFFVAEAVDLLGNTIDKVVEVGNPSNPFINSTNNGNTYYRNWRCAKLDLSNRIGQEVIVMFINSDCSRSVHKGYTYLDAICETCTNTNEGDVNINLGVDSCLVFPITIGGAFSMPLSGLAQNWNITLQIFQNNTLINTVSNPTISGSNYSFSLNATDFPNHTNGQCYDLVSNLSFDYPNMNGQLVHISQLSSTVNSVTGIQDGERSGINNDVCFCSNNELCCNIPNLSASLTENNGTFNLNLNGGTVPIQEVEISMLDYHVTYSQPDCQPVNMNGTNGNIGNMTTTVTNLNSLVLDANSNNSHVLTWLPGTPAIINNQINFSVNAPAILNITCCELSGSFCIKVRVKDINCNVCEKILCYPSSSSSCDCGNWNSNYMYLGINPQTPLSSRPFPVACGGSITYDGPRSLHIGIGDYSCIPLSCQDTYRWSVTGPVTGNGTGKPFDFNFSQAGTYTVTITPYCENLPCEPCKITVIIRSVTICDCKGQGWIKDKPAIISSNGQVIGNVFCESSLSIDQITAPPYLCNPANINPTYTWNIYFNGTLANSGSGNNFINNFSQQGYYTIEFIPNCCGNTCPPCKFEIGIKNPLPSCDCGKWKDNKITVNWRDRRGNQTTTVDCDNTNPYLLSDLCSNVPITGNFSDYVCIPANCQVKYYWIILDENSNVVASDNETTSTSFSFSIASSGNYQFVITPKCNDTRCEPCRIRFSVKNVINCK